MVSRIFNLMETNNVSAYKLGIDCSIPNPNITSWKLGRSKPSTDAIIKIAKYFGVSTDYLLTGHEFVSPVSSLSSQEKKALEKFNKLDNDQIPVVFDFLDLQLKYSKKANEKNKQA